MSHLRTFFFLGVTLSFDILCLMPAIVTIVFAQRYFARTYLEVGGGGAPSSVALSGKEKDDPQPTVTRVSILNNFAIRFKQLKLHGQIQHVTTLPLTVTLFICDDEASSFFLTSATFPIVID